MKTHLTTDTEVRKMIEAIRKTPLHITGEVGDAVVVETTRHGVIFRAIWKDPRTVLVSMVPDFFGN